MTTDGIKWCLRMVSSGLNAGQQQLNNGLIMFEIEKMIVVDQGLNKGNIDYNHH